MLLTWLRIKIANPNKIQKKLMSNCKIPKRMNWFIKNDKKINVSYFAKKNNKWQVTLKRG